MKKNEFMLVRHSYDDHSYINGKNDTSLTSKGIKMAEDASRVILPKIECSPVVIRHSVKKRAEETAYIIGEELLRHNINCVFKQENGLTELFQGNFDFGTMSHEDRINFLQSCWDDFEGCRKQGILDHHFGQNKDRSVILTPGECHAEWSARIAKGVLNIIDDLEQSYQSINITHRGALFEITGIVQMVNGLITPDQVETYETVWMSYCQDYILHINDLKKAKVLTKDYMNQRSKNENNN